MKQASKAVRELEMVLGLAAKYRVEAIKVGDIEVKLSAASYAPVIEGKDVLKSSDGTDKCKCGHSISVEHNEHGLCLHGCAVELCVDEE